MSWIPADTCLKGGTIDLVPLSEGHFDELVSLSAEPRIWEFIPADCSTGEKYRQLLEVALIEKELGTQFPFAILHKPTNTLVGSTRFMDIQERHKKLEIGWTWLHPNLWSTTVNPECKLLLLDFCFGLLQAARVQLKTDENNIRSRKAIAKIGAQFEGILRHDMVRPNGTLRNSAYFSIINTEWQTARAKINDLINQRK